MIWGILKFEMEGLHIPVHKMAAKKVFHPWLYLDIGGGGTLALAEVVRVAGMGVARCMLEEGGWCMKPEKVENIT